MAGIVENGISEVYVLDAESLRIVYANRTARERTGYAAAELRGRTPLALLPYVEPAEWAERLEPLRRGEQVAVCFEAVQRRKDGSTYPVETAIKRIRPSGRAGAEAGHLFVAYTRDISLRRAQEERLRHLAYHDPLTGLPNRRLLVDRLDLAVTRAARGSEGVLLFLDLDNFKQVNDTLGHAHGDRLLVRLSRLLNDSVRASDLLARLGGDEFAVLLENTPFETAEHVTSRLRLAVERFAFGAEGRRFPLSFSIGVTLIDGSTDAQGLLMQADSALYTAKGDGKGRVVVWRVDGGETPRPPAANQWSARVREALEARRFHMLFQPAVRCSDGRVEFHEGLVRLRDEAGELIEPDAFLRVAEVVGLAGQIDRWAVEHVVGVLQRRGRGDPAARRVFLRLSAPALCDEAFLGFVEEHGTRCGLPPRSLGFMIDESTAVLEQSRLRRWIGRLAPHGCCFALDEFGAGFSSFAALRSLPVEYLKIDGTVIQHLDRDPGTQAVVRAICAMAGELGRRTVAQGVENAAVAAAVQAAGVDLGEGPHYGGPVQRLRR